MYKRQGRNYELNRSNMHKTLSEKVLDRVYNMDQYANIK